MRLVLETERLRLRPWQVVEAPVLRELWTERDARVPPHRRIDADGRPTLADLGNQIGDESFSRLLALERKTDGEVLGYCGLVDSGRAAPGGPELAVELLRRHRGQGYATEAALAVLDEARAAGHRRLWATVWDWNTPSRRLLARLGFTETDRVEVEAERGTTLFTTLQL